MVSREKGAPYRTKRRPFGSTKGPFEAPMGTFAGLYQTSVARRGPPAGRHREGPPMFKQGSGLFASKRR